MNIDEYVVRELDKRAEDVVGPLTGGALDEIVNWDSAHLHALNMELLRRLHHKLFDPPVYDPIAVHAVSGVNVSEPVASGLICRFHADCAKTNWTHRLRRFPYNHGMGYTPQSIFNSLFEFMFDEGMVEIGRAYHDEFMRFKTLLVGMKVGAQHDDVKVKSSSGPSRPVPRRIKVWRKDKPVPSTKGRSG